MANKKRLIEANALINHMKDLPTRYEDGGGSWLCLDGYPKGMFDPEDVISSIENAPTVDAVEVVHGWWIVDKEHLKATCSECGKILRFSDEMQIAFLHDEERFCYYCGAKMDGERKDNG